MDFNTLGVKEIISKIYKVSKQIIEIYNELIKLNNEGKDINADIKLIERLKSLISQEKEMIHSIPDDKLEKCGLILARVGKEHLLEKGIKEDEIFEFTKEEKDVETRMHMYIFERELEKKGRTITYCPNNITFLPSHSYVVICFIEVYMSIYNTKLNKTTIDDKESFNKILSFLNNKLLNLMTISPLLEKIIFSYNDKIIISIDNEDFNNFIKEIPSLLATKDTRDVVPYLLSEESVIAFLNQLSKMEENNTSEINYLFKITQLEVALSYLNEESLNIVKERFDKRTSNQFTSDAIRQEVERYFVKHYARVRKNN